MFNPPHPLTYADSLRAFLKEDWGTQDWTTASVPDRPMAAHVVAKEALVLAGLPVAAQVFLEASGNLGLDRARAVAETGVDYLSVGALTHSAAAADLSLRF